MTTAVYIGVGAGYGQVYDIAFASLVRIAGVRLFLHYDSYAYLELRRPLTAALIRMAGPSATHIVLCNDMERCLLKLYGGSLRVVVVPNATNTEVPVSEPTARIKLNTLGFISNLSRTKGVMEFLDVAEHMCNAHPDMRAILAGPIEDVYLEPVIKQRVHDAEWLTYLGPVYRERKSGFYSDIDVFLFPTRYVNEADPRVISEALAYGVVVVAT
ncbi:MAG TPA: glycosyltransferase family 4 protein, partial [Candidatus Acidoferrum sp.]|nr:glycosyltransferase family 4 protein [Candidatus Acidoferrum sp.]